MKGAHYRRRPLGSKVEKIIFVLGMALFGTAIGIAVSDAHPDGRVSPKPTTTTQAPTTTTIVTGRCQSLRQRPLSRFRGRLQRTDPYRRYERRRSVRPRRQLQATPVQPLEPSS